MNKHALLILLVCGVQSIFGSEDHKTNQYERAAQDPSEVTPRRATSDNADRCSQCPLSMDEILERISQDNPPAQPVQPADASNDRGHWHGGTWITAKGTRRLRPPLPDNPEWVQPGSREDVCNCASGSRAAQAQPIRPIISSQQNATDDGRAGVEESYRRAAETAQAVRQPINNRAAHAASLIAREIMRRASGEIDLPTDTFGQPIDGAVTFNPGPYFEFHRNIWQRVTIPHYGFYDAPMWEYLRMHISNFVQMRSPFFGGFDEAGRPFIAVAVKITSNLMTEYPDNNPIFEPVRVFVVHGRYANNHTNWVVEETGHVGFGLFGLKFLFAPRYGQVLEPAFLKLATLLINRSCQFTRECPALRAGDYRQETLTLRLATLAEIADFNRKVLANEAKEEAEGAKGEREEKDNRRDGSGAAAQ